MSFEFSDKAKLERDSRLRRALLEMIYNCRNSPRGGIQGRPLVTIIDSSVAAGMSFEDDGHAVSLIRDLVNKALISEERDPNRSKNGRFTPDHLFLRITDAGSRLCRGKSPVDPDIADDRAGED